MPLRYTDEVDLAWSTAAVKTFGVTPRPDSDNPVALELDGHCPRCKDSMPHTEFLIAFKGVSTKNSDALSETLKPLWDKGVVNEPLLPTEFGVRCCCNVKHPDPLGRSGLKGCGATWKMRIETVDRVIKPVPPHDPNPSASEIGDRARLAEEVRGSLEKVRKTAENWRTGVAGLVTLVTAILLFKGQNTITSYEPWVRYILGGLALFAVGLAIASLWLFLLAAYGRVRPVSTQSILEEGGVDVRNVHLATTALDDLRLAQWLAIGSAVLLAAAIAFSWYGPAVASKPLALVKIVVRGERAGEFAETMCGELTAQDGATTILKINGEPDPRRIATQRLVSFVLVAKC